jgi:hypothetical protein
MTCGVEAESMRVTDPNGKMSERSILPQLTAHALSTLSRAAVAYR